jgi:hypothetical protein
MSQPRARRPADHLADYCERLRLAVVEPSRHLTVDEADVPRLLGASARALLAQFPTDRDLSAAVARLAERGFRLPPPAPDRLPLSDPGRAWDALPPVDRQAVAAAVLALPDPARNFAEAASLFELFLRLPGELPRARSLAGSLARHEQPPEAALRSLRLTLAEASAALPDQPSARPEWGGLLAPFRRAPLVPALSEALRLAAAFELRHPVRPDRVPFGLGWLAQVAGGHTVVNVTLAQARRPALRDEAARILDWLNEAGPPAWLSEVERLDAAGAFESATHVLEDVLSRHATPEERRVALAARDELLEVTSSGLRLAGLRFRLPPRAFARPEAPRTGWTRHLEAMLSRPTLAVASSEEAGLAAALDERALVSDHLASSRDAALVGLPGGRTRAEVLGILGLEVPLDERSFASEALERGLIVHHLLAESPEATLTRDLLALRLLGAGERPLRDDEPSTPSPRGPIEAPSDDPLVEPDSPHHPEHRLRAARDLIAAEQFAPASAILAALLRRAPRGEGLFGVLGDMLEADARPEDTAELRHAAARALDDDRRSAPLLNLLVRRPLAAYSLHEDLYDYGVDPSRPDGRRLEALTAWLGIWVATDTPPDEAAVARIREVGEPLLALAAARLGGALSPLRAAATFLTSARHLPNAHFAELLLGLARG